MSGDASIYYSARKNKNFVDKSGKDYLMQKSLIQIQTTTLTNTLTKHEQTTLEENVIRLQVISF